jgi:hypothetical protein
MPSIENRQHPRIPVSVAVSYSSLDDQGTPLNFNLGMVKDVSQSGVALEVYSEPGSKLILLSFVDVSGNSLEIKGKSVYLIKIAYGTFKLGVTLLGSPVENICFVKELVRFHHYTKKSISNGPH